MTDNNNNFYEYDDYVNERRGDASDFGGPLLLPFLIFLIIICFCGQSCLLIHLNCSDMFKRGLTNAKIKVLIAAGNNKQDNDEYTEAHSDKNNLDLSVTNNSGGDVVVPPIIETSTPPNRIRMSRRNSM